MTYWFTFNEIWADASNTYIEGTFPRRRQGASGRGLPVRAQHDARPRQGRTGLPQRRFKGKIGVIQSLEFKYPLNENDPADIKAANNEHVLQNQFLLDATFRGDYAPDTPRVRQPSGCRLGRHHRDPDEDLEIMREAALYNDYRRQQLPVPLLEGFTMARTTCTTTVRARRAPAAGALRVLASM